jgi:hypothetical protein
MTVEQRAAMPVESQERHLAMAFMLHCNRSRYGRLIEENSYLKGADNWPTTMTAAYSLLTNYRQDPRNMVRMGTGDGVAFTNDGSRYDLGSGWIKETITQSGTYHVPQMRDGKEVDMTLAQGGSKKPSPGWARIMCHKCGKKGHYASECTANEKEDKHGGKKNATTLVNEGIASGEFDEGEQLHFTDGCQFMTDGINLNNDFGGGRVPNDWILLDNQSTVDVFHNPKLLTKIRKSDHQMDIHCNALQCRSGNHEHDR